jgi:Cu/Ag efflux protein CusF
MKTLILTTAFWVAIVMTAPVFAANQNYNNGKSSTSDANNSDAMIEGTITNVDPMSETVTIKENASGMSRTFTNAKKNELQSLKQGDKVKIKPQANDPSKAQKIEKNNS